MQKKRIILITFVLISILRLDWRFFYAFKYYSLQLRLVYKMHFKYKQEEWCQHETAAAAAARRRRLLRRQYNALRVVRLE